MDTLAPINADRWIAHMFSAKAAEGQVIRRQRDWVTREIGIPRFMAEVKARGFHLIQTADQFVIVCHSGEIRLLF